VSLDDLANVDRVIGARDARRVVRVADQPDAALRRHPPRRRRLPARGVTSVIDNTFASSFNQQPLSLVSTCRCRARRSI